MSSQDVSPYAVPLAAAVLAVTAYLLALPIGRRSAPDHWQWLKDWVAPLTTALVILLLGAFLQIAASERQATAERLEREAAVMREVMTSQDRRDIAHVVAAAKQLSIRLQRCSQIRGMAAGGRSSKVGPVKAQAGLRRTAVTKEQNFDLVAAYFFFSMIRAADVDLEATQGSVSFRRVWMEDRFHRLIHELVEHVLGGETRAVSIPAQEEAAQYRYFGRHSVPVLWDFYGVIKAKGNHSAAPEAHALRRGYERFRERLFDGSIRVGKVDSTYRAMDGLWAYAWNDVFADWYGRKRDVLPDSVPIVPPKGFLPRDEVRRDSLWAAVRKARGAW